jgi:hypothetical protein
VKKKERKKVEKRAFPSHGYEVAWAMVMSQLFSR